jgi:enoyl-CoA hydratase
VSESTVLVAADAGVATLTINRPAALNALNSTVLVELDQAVTALSADPSIRAVVLTGAGAKSFVAGADIVEMSGYGPQAARRFASLGHRVLGALEALPIPVIAAVNGFCLGGGCELALACDLIYASDTARFGQPEVNLGLMPGFGGTQRLARRVGAARAAELIYTARQVKADEALRIGLVLDVVPLADLLARVHEMAAGIAAKGPAAVRASKLAIARGLDAPLAVGNALEIETFANLFDTADAREGMQAFVEKRPAHFRNA